MAGFLGLGSLGGVGDIVAHVSISGDQAFIKKLDTLDASVQKSAQIQSAAMNAALIAGAAAFVGAVVAASSYESKMADIHTLMVGQEDAFQKINDQVLDLSTNMPLSANDLSSAMYQIVSATVPAKDAMNVLEVSSKAAVGGVANVADTFNLFSAVIKGYSLDWSEVGRISDIAFQTVKLGQTTMQELSTSMQGTIPLAATLGIRFEEVSGAAAALTGVTGNTNEVMTQLEGIMTLLAKKPTEELGASFDALGVKS